MEDSGTCLPPMVKNVMIKKAFPKLPRHKGLESGFRMKESADVNH